MTAAARSGKTHREVKKPELTARYLAEYMAGTERSRRSTIRKCKYQPIASVVQHDDAKIVISRAIVQGNLNHEHLAREAERVRAKIYDTDFEREKNEHNADYISRFNLMLSKLEMPRVNYGAPLTKSSIMLGGTKVKIEFVASLSRVAKNTKTMHGGACLRYAKGKRLPEEVAKWHAAFIYGYLEGVYEKDEMADAERQLCLVIDAHEGAVFSAPSDSITRFRNMEAACATIAEGWDNIAPPEGAIL